MTKLNREILELVLNTEGHLTAEDVFFLAKKKNINVSLASVYRILNKLADEGKLRRVSNIKDKAIYDKYTKDHGHLVCNKCGKVTDIEFDSIQDYLCKTTKKKVSSYDLCMYYICDKCKKGK